MPSQNEHLQFLLLCDHERHVKCISVMVATAGALLPMEVGFKMKSACVGATTLAQCRVARMHCTNLKTCMRYTSLALTLMKTDHVIYDLLRYSLRPYSSGHMEKICPHLCQWIWICRSYHIIISPLVVQRLALLVTGNEID